MSKLPWLLCLLSPMVTAQTPTAEITGSVTDSTGGVVMGAAVTVTNSDTNARRALVTNLAGVYDAPGLLPGRYSLRISMSGFKAQLQNDIELQVG
jgi:hypothetical protein